MFPKFVSLAVVEILQRWVRGVVRHHERGAMIPAWDKRNQTPEVSGAESRAKKTGLPPMGDFNVMTSPPVTTLTPNAWNRETSLL